MLVLGHRGLSKLPEVHFEFAFIVIGKSPMDFQHANCGMYSNPGTQEGAQNKNFGAVSQTDL